MNLIALFLLIGLILGFMLSLKFFKTKALESRMVNAPFPKGWDETLKSNLPVTQALGPKAYANLCQRIQKSLATLEVHDLGETSTQTKDHLIALTPFLIFELADKQSSFKGLTRILLIDESYGENEVPKEDPHDLVLRWSGFLNRCVAIEGKEEGSYSVKTYKTLEKILGPKMSQNLKHKSLMLQYLSKAKSAHLRSAANQLASILTSEFYVADEETTEELIWKLHEVFCFYPENLKAALPQFYQGLLEYYELVD